MMRRTGSASLLPVLLLFAATPLPDLSYPAATSVPVGCGNGIVQALADPVEFAVSQPTGTASTTVLTGGARHGPGWDYGDAPPPYPTRRSQHGPRHLITIVGALTIGTTVTAEAKGRPDDGDVDDGLATPVRVSLGKPQVTVRVRNTSGFRALLVGWLDTAGDGFAATERAAVPVPVGAKHVTLRWTLPPGTRAGTGELRLRLYKGRPGHAAPTGVALGGEVEDYRVGLVGPAPQPTPTRPTPQQPAPGRPAQPTPSRPAQPPSTSPGQSPPPTGASTSASSRPAPAAPSPAISARARTVPHAEPSYPRRGLPLTWSMALLIVAPAAAGAAHAVGRAARRRP